MKYIFSIFSTGAVRKTPKRIIDKILAEIDPQKTNVIEFGAGKGEITERMVRLHSNKLPVDYYAFEIDEKFAVSIQNSLPEIKVFKENAFHFDEYIPSDFRPDYIICSMPLSFYSRVKISSLLQKMKERLGENGKIIVLFHAFWLIPILRRRFKKAVIHRFATLPPYFLLVFDSGRTCKK
jgi:phospholipid N-methyltransferase